MWYLGVIGPCQEQALPLYFFLLQSFNTCRSMLLDYPFPSLPSWNILASVDSWSENTCSRSTSMSLVLKMAWKWLCPDGKNSTLAKKKKKPPAAEKKTPPLTMTISETAHHSDSAHKNKRIGLFTADKMRACIAEINFYEQRQKDLGLENLTNQQTRYVRSMVLPLPQSPNKWQGRWSG